MTNQNQFFSLPDVKLNLRELVTRNGSNSSSDNSRLDMLAPVFSAMLESSADWDSACQFTIIKYGAQFRIVLNDVVRASNPSHVDLCLAFIYVFLVEADLSTITPFSDLFMSIKENISLQMKDREDRPGVLVSYAARQLPIQILKELINSPQLGSLKEIGTAADDAQAKIDKWREELSARQETVEQLNGVLDRQRDAYNFVLLNQGFAGLEETTTKELRKLRKYLLGFGILMLSPVFIDLYLIANEIVNLDSTKVARLVAGAVISVTSTLIFLYFFRIVLREVDSKEAQLMQIRLRMTLCQFIQNYADYAADLKAKNVDALSKFENLIFSGIVGTQDKLPSTFDGIEQISSLIKNARSK